MNLYRFPEQKTALSNIPLTRENLFRIFEEIFRVPDRAFTGFLKVTADSSSVYFFFLLQSEPYAAGIYTGIKPFSLSITDFFAEIFSPHASKMSLSLHETDPVLLKSMLIFLQDEPTVKAPVNLIDLELIIRQIRDEAADALVVLEKEGMFNFFFFKNGKAALSHLADTSWAPPGDLSVEEQMQVYAFETSENPVVACIYRNVATEKAADAGQLSCQLLLDMARGGASTDGTISMGRAIAVEVMTGVDQGKMFRVSVPCCIGRKDCEIVLNDLLVSRRHAVIQEENGQLIIVDQDSTNGTFVNVEKISRLVLSPSDVITVGDTTLKIVE